MCTYQDGQEESVKRVRRLSPLPTTSQPTHQNSHTNRTTISTTLSTVPSAWFQTLQAFLPQILQHLFVLLQPLSMYN